MAIATGDITTSSGSVELELLPHESLCLIQTYGTFTGLAYKIEGSLDGTNYSLVSFIDRSTFSDDADAALSSQSAGKILEVNCSGLKKLKLTSTAYSSGTMSVIMKSTSRLPITQIAGG